MSTNKKLEVLIMQYYDGFYICAERYTKPKTLKRIHDVGAYCMKKYPDAEFCFIGEYEARTTFVNYCESVKKIEKILEKTRGEKGE